MKVCPTLASVTGLLGGYKVASTTGNRPLGGAVLGVCGIIAFMNWKRKAGHPCYLPDRSVPGCFRRISSARQEDWRVAFGLHSDRNNRSRFDPYWS